MTKDQAAVKTGFGGLFAQYRKQRKLSMQKLATAADISAAYVCRLESGDRHPSRDLVLRLADILLPYGTQSEKDELLVIAGYAPINHRNFMGRQDVVAIYEQQVSESPEDFKAFIGLVISQVRVANYTRAKELIQTGMEHFDDMVQLQALMAVMELSKKNYAQAILFQQEAIRYFLMDKQPERLHLSHADLLLGLGVMYFEQGNELAYQVQIALNQKKQTNNSDLTAQSLRLLEQAEQQFQKALDLQAGDIYVVDELARVNFTIAYLKVGAAAQPYWEKCIASFEEMLFSADKQSLGYHALLQSNAFLALAYSKAGQFSQARFMLSTIESCLPHFWLAHYMKACYFCLLYLDNQQEALLHQAMDSLKKAAAVPDEQNQTLFEAPLDTDLAPVRDFFKDDFQSLLQGVA